MEFEKKHYLIVVDYYSRYIEVRKLDSLTSTSTVDKLKSIFAAHGIPELLISENGPQFSSGEIQEFARTFGFQHMTSSPKYPMCRTPHSNQSNTRRIKKSTTR